MNISYVFSYPCTHVDGFSPFPSILAFFPGLSDSNLPPHWDIEQSLDEDSPTVLLNAITGRPEITVEKWRANPY